MMLPATPTVTMSTRLEAAMNVSGSPSGSLKYGATSTRLVSAASVWAGMEPEIRGARFAPSASSTTTAVRSSLTCLARMGVLGVTLVSV